MAPPACLSLPFHYNVPVYISQLIKANESKEKADVLSEKCNLINVCVCKAARLGTSFMLFTCCKVLAGEGTLIIKTLYKG